MRTSLKTFLAGAVVLVTVGAVGPALAGDAQTHILNVQLPDGSVEQIRYTGDVAPQIVVAPAPFVFAAPGFAFGPSFAELRRISAILDQQAAAMIRQAAAMPMMISGGMEGLPPGAHGYSMIATSSGDGVCMRSTQITYRSGDAKPEVVSHTSGSCGPAQGPSVPAEVNAPAPQPASSPRTIEVKANGHTPYLAMAQPVAFDSH